MMHNQRFVSKPPKEINDKKFQLKNEIYTDISLTELNDLRSQKDTLKKELNELETELKLLLQSTNDEDEVEYLNCQVSTLEEKIKGLENFKEIEKQELQIQINLIIQEFEKIEGSIARNNKRFSPQVENQLKELIEDLYVSLCKEKCDCSKASSNSLRLR